MAEPKRLQGRNVRFWTCAYMKNVSSAEALQTRGVAFQPPENFEMSGLGNAISDNFRGTFQ